MKRFRIIVSSFAIIKSIYKVFCYFSMTSTSEESGGPLLFMIDVLDHLTEKIIKMVWDLDFLLMT